MGKETYKTNPGIDIRNRRELNLQNQVPENNEYEIEATNTINPITGKPYDILKELELELEFFNPLKYGWRGLCKTILKKDNSKYITFPEKNPKKDNSKYILFSEKTLKKDKIPKDKGNKDINCIFKETEINELIELRFALARMDVADGKMSEQEYLEYRQFSNEVVTRLKKANLLPLIDYGKTFIEALEQVKEEKRINQSAMYLEDIINKYKMSSRTIKERYMPPIYLGSNGELLRCRI